MLKRKKKTSPKKQKSPPSDVNQLARHLVELTTSSVDGEQAEPTPEEVSKVMAALGKRGGKVGGKRRLETMTPEERSNVAAKAARAMWAKRKRASGEENKLNPKGTRS